mmetsp:Transcript_81378/g.131905  ORF Transcript_81378/g.131905 Transcript_81378/m.131905 type:complete len:301 (+) Transcript_81378:124-1026(+)
MFPFYLITLVSITLVMMFHGIFLCVGCGTALPPEPSTRSKKPRILFDGAGWAFPFSLGASRHLVHTYNFGTNVEVIGVSAGNISAICLLLERDPWDLLVEHYPKFRRNIMCSPCVRPLIGFCSRLGMVRMLLDDLIPDDFHIKVSGRFHVVVNSWPSMNLRYISTFHSKQELIDAVLCSMALPGFVALPLYSAYSGWGGLYVDGGLRHMMTPLESRADVTIRTLTNPLKTLFRHLAADVSWNEDDVVRPQHRLNPCTILWPPTLTAVYNLMEEGRSQTMQNTSLQHNVLLAPYLRANANI